MCGEDGQSECDIYRMYEQLKKYENVGYAPEEIEDLITCLDVDGDGFSNKSVLDDLIELMHYRKRNDNRQKIKRIADHYGFEAQSMQLIEEMAELTQAICKIKRYKNSEGYDKLEDLSENLCEEMADVRLVLKQCIYLFSDSRVNEIEQSKIERTLSRIESDSGEKPKI